MEVVIVSMKCMAWMLEFYLPQLHSSPGVSPDKIIARFESVLGKQSECLEVDFQSEAFRDAVLQTPFRLGRRGRNANSKMFFVCPARKWKNFLQTIVPQNQRQITVDQSRSKSALANFGQRYAFTDEKFKIMQWMYKIPQSKKACIPAFGMKWWKESFSQSVRTYFETAECVHVASPDIGPKVVRTFVEAKDDAA